MSTPPPALYPPESHALRDLPFDIVAHAAGHYRATIDLDAGLAPDGVVSVAALATVVDVLAGSICMRTISPDWMATSSLALHLGELPTSGLLHVDAGIARAGRTTVVVQITLRVVAGGAAAGGGVAGGADAGSAVAGGGGDGNPAVGDGVVSFSRLPRRDTNLDVGDDEPEPGHRVSFALPDSGLRTTFEAAIGTTVLDAAAGVTSTAVLPYVQNSFGAVNGGIVAGIAGIAAAAVVDPGAATDRGAGAWRPNDLSVHYLSQVRSGAVATSATIVRADEHHATVRVELFDAAGPPQRAAGSAVTPGSWAPLMAVAHVTMARSERTVSPAGVWV
jgi:acyl-coenzyme A thioesterase PaaI-like protein